MKKIIFVLVSILFIQSVKGQWDEKFYHPNKQWAPIESLAYEEILFTADADTIHSILLEPDKEVKATILYFHGNGANASQWINHVKPLVEDGFRICLMDYRGYGKSTGKPTHLCIAADAQQLFDLLILRKDISQTPLWVYGASIGTQVATHLTKNNQDKISALILDGMMASFTDIAVATSPVEAREYVRQYVTSPYAAKEDIQELKDTKLLVIHSEEDVIPIAGAREVYERASCPKSFWLYEGKHIEAPLKYPAQLLEYVNQLF